MTCSIEGCEKPTDGKRSVCRMHRARIQKWGDPHRNARSGRPKDPALAHLSRSERIRRSSLKQRYGIDLDDYGAMLIAQDYRCASCGKEPRAGGSPLHVDHDHETGRVRELLCTRCNTALAVVENKKLMAQLLVYLSRHVDQ